jgi:hypothetical protein
MNLKSATVKKEYLLFPCGKNRQFFTALFLKKEDNGSCLFKIK